MLAETLQRNTGAGGKHTVATFLDAEKAFDVVWHDRLLRKLALLDIPMDIWAALHQWHGNISSKVKWEDHISDEIRIYQGVRKGGTSSPLLYKIFLNDLFLTRKDRGEGLSTGSTPVVCPTVAYYVIKVAENEEKGQQLLHVVEEYTHMNQYTINASKSEVKSVSTLV